MKKYANDDLIFFAEWVPYEESNPEEKEKAKAYLLMWKEILLRKLRSELWNYKQIGEDHWIDRPAMYSGPLCLYGSLCLKLAMKKSLPYEVGADGTMSSETV